MGDSDLAGGELRVRRRGREPPVCVQRLPAALLVEPGENERSQALTGRPQLLGLRQRALDESLDVDALRRRVGKQNAGAAELPVCGGNRRNVLGFFNPLETGGPPASS